MFSQVTGTLAGQPIFCNIKTIILCSTHIENFMLLSDSTANIMLVVQKNTIKEFLSWNVRQVRIKAPNNCIINVEFSEINLIGSIAKVFCIAFEYQIKSKIKANLPSLPTKKWYE